MRAARRAPTGVAAPRVTSASSAVSNLDWAHTHYTNIGVPVITPTTYSMAHAAISR